MESLKGLARMINGLADSLQENGDIKVTSETQENILFVKQVLDMDNGYPDP